MSAILITGASGYIGSHLVRSFFQSAIPLRGFARRDKPAEMPYMVWYQGDISRPQDLDAAVQGCEAVIHLACLPLKASQENPGEALRVNTLGTWNLLRTMGKAEVRRLIFLSTAQVYGRPLKLPISEEQPPQPESAYATSKLCAERMCATFARHYQADVTILRVFNVYGTLLSNRVASTVETIFVRRVLQGLPPVIQSHPQEGRDFIYITDVIRAIHLALEAEKGLQVLNIGSGVMTTLHELAQLVIAIAGAPLTPLIQTREVEGSTATHERPMQLQADIRRAQQVLGFQPQLSLCQGLTELFEALRSSERPA